MSLFLELSGGSAAHRKLRVRGIHGTIPAAMHCSRIVSRPRFTCDFTVPKGNPQCLAISAWVSPRRKASESACLWAGVKAASIARSLQPRCESSHARSGVSSSASAAASSSCTSTTTSRRASAAMRRRESNERLRAMVRNHAMAEPRAGSNREASRHACSKASATTSSARSLRRRIDVAIDKARAVHLTLSRPSAVSSPSAIAATHAASPPSMQAGSPVPSVITRV
jgi:hypothetical protein